MKNPPTLTLVHSEDSTVTDAVRVQILATEHWSLLATRTMSWNEAFSRASMFLTVLSAAMVGLAFVAQATAFGQGFRLFALGVLPIVLLLGLGTYSRLVLINTEDFWLMVGMNRLRHAYLELAPDLEPYFLTQHHDDIASVWQTQSHGARPSVGFGQILASTPSLVGAIDAVLAGVLVAVIVQTMGAPLESGVAAAAFVGVLFLIALVAPAMRRLRALHRDYSPRFPG